MSGKRVLVVDDVISTGGSLKALDELAEQTQCTIVGQAAVLAEGECCPAQGHHLPRAAASVPPLNRYATPALRVSA